jgi:hypothetical protein
MHDVSVLGGKIRNYSPIILTLEEFYIGKEGNAVKSIDFT